MEAAMKAQRSIEAESNPAAQNQPAGEATSTRKSRYRAETDLLNQAVSGNPQATQRILQYLSSPNPNLHHIMLATLHESRDPLIWQRLLACLALRCWIDALPQSPSQPGSEPVSKVEITIERAGVPASEPKTTSEFEWHENLEMSIVEAFIIDKEPEEGHLKNSILHTITQDKPDTDETKKRLRFAAAYLLGLRGDLSALSILEEMIDGLSHLKPTGSRRGASQPAAIEEGRLWGMRAVQALETLHDESCAHPLVQALAAGHQIGYRTLHLEARRALSDLGPLAEDAWLEALHHPNSHIRWHAARGLGQIGNPHALDILARGLYDENQEVRWATARVLAQLDTTAVPAILSVLCQHPLTQPFREAAYHSLNSMPSASTRSYLKPLLDVLQSSTTSSEAPAVAQRLLAEWKKVEEINYEQTS